MSLKISAVVAPQDGRLAELNKISADEAAAIARITRCFNDLPQEIPKDREPLTAEWGRIWLGDINHSADIREVNAWIKAKTITFAKITEIYQGQANPTSQQRKILTEFYNTQKQYNFPSTAIWVIYKIFGSLANCFFKDAAKIFAAEDFFNKIQGDAEITRQDKLRLAEAAAKSIKKRLNVICQSNPSCLYNPKTLQDFKARIIALKTETREIINELNSCRDELIFLQAEALKSTKKTPKTIHNCISEIFALSANLEGFLWEISDTEKNLFDPIHHIIKSFNQLKTEDELLEIARRAHNDPYTYYTEVGNHKEVLNKINDFIIKTIYSIKKDTWTLETGKPLDTLYKDINSLLSSTNPADTTHIEKLLLNSGFLDANKVALLLNIRAGLKNQLIRADLLAKQTAQAQGRKLI